MAPDVAERNAFELYMQAAELGDPAAMTEVVRYYDSGSGIGKDPAAAMRWLRVSAELDNGISQYKLAARMQKGEGVPKDLFGARYWYERAAMKDNSSEARVALAKLYDGADDFPKNEALAVHWYKRAAALNDKEAIDWLTAKGHIQADPAQTAFIERIERQGPSRASAAAFYTDVAQYCKYGGKRCTALTYEANQFIQNSNAMADRANLERIWNGGNTSSADDAARRAKSECMRRKTQSLQRYTYGQQDWYFAGDC